MLWIIRSTETEKLSYLGRFHRGVADDAGLLGCYTMLIGRQLLMFLRVIVPSASRSHSPRRLQEEVV